MAADYLERQFRSIGLQPISKDLGFRQTVDVFTGVRVEGVIGMRDLARGYEFTKDYAPLGLSADGRFLGDLVFVGYGVTAPEHGYDDYAAVDVTGKLVLAFLGEPGNIDADSPFDGADQTMHSDLYRKASVAKEHGAAGLLLTPGPLHTKDPERVWRISAEAAFYNCGILAAQVTVSAAAALVSPGGIDLPKLQSQIDDSYRPVSTPVATQQVELMIELQRTPTKLENVVGKIPGRTDDGLLVLANHDGFGMGSDPKQSRLHPSANGNASGIAALVEIARTLVAMPDPEKTVYFAAVAGRQIGSAGAEALVREGIIPTEDLSCVLTLFALGVPTFTRLEVMGSKTGDGLPELLKSVNSEVREPVELRLDPDPAKSGDHVPFARAKVPVLTFFGGSYDEYGTPADSPEVLLYPGFVRNCRYIYGVVQALASRSERIAYAG